MENQERLKAALADRYRIEREIGSGGMATVYLAQDLKHDRKVAVKVLKPELAAVLGADRFLGEIKVTANLQHPHILPLHDSGEADGFLFYVMPLVEGESLRTKLDREKQLSVDEAVGIAKAVASALDYAHRHGVIHRDIKPANILLHDGQPMVADFGIALAVRAAGGARLTETGLSLGTPQYMSPEQAAGDREVDGRSDVYSLGSVSYEMLAGEPPHVGPTVQAVIAKLLTDKPRQVTELRETVPVQVAAAVHKALAKLPADRFRTAGEFADLLSGGGSLASVGTGGLSGGRPTGGGHLLCIFPWVVVMGLLVVLTVVASRDHSPISSSEASLVNIVLPDTVPMVFVGEAWGGIAQSALALAPDGRTLAYVGQSGATTRLYVRSLDQYGVRALPGTEGALLPFYSPDGQWIGFFANDRLLRVSLDGERIAPITEAFQPYGASWSDQGQIASVTRDSRELLITGPTGSSAIHHPLGRDQGHYFAQPQWLPRGEWFLATCYTPFELCAVSAESREIRRLMTSGVAGSPGGVPLQGASPRYVDGGYVVFSDPAENVVLGVRFDPDRLETLSEPVELLRGVRRENMQGVIQLSVTQSGDMVYAPGPNANRGHLVWAGPNETRDTLPFPPRVYGAFFLSLDGDRVAALATSDIGETELWLMDLQQERAERWTPDDNEREAGIEYGIWLPDSESVLLTLSRGDSCELIVVDARRGEGGERVWQGKGMVKAQYVTPDSLILFTVYGPRGAYVAEAPFNALSDLPSDAEEAFPSLTGASGNEAFPRYSPDGRWLLYNSDFRGPWDLYAQRTESGSVPIRISPEGGGDMAQWAPSGDGIYFRRGQRYFWTAQTGNPDRPFSEPRLVLDGDFLNVDGPEMEVHPDGRRLLLLEGPGQRTTTELNLILNWKQHLKELMGGRR